MTDKATDVTMALLGEDMARKKRPGRPKASETGGDAAPGDRPVLYVTLTADLWNRLTRSVERRRVKDGYPNLSRADVVRSLLDRALAAEEAESK